MESLFITPTKNSKIRILTPTEYDLIESSLASVGKDEYVDASEMEARENARVVFRVAFYLATRYRELVRLHDNPEWVMWERSMIQLPNSAQGKAKQKIKTRYIPFNQNQIGTDLRLFFKVPELLHHSNWNLRLKRAAEKSGIGTDGISPKMVRASLECWLLAAGWNQTKICLRQGHDSFTALKHYSAIPFSPLETEEITRRLTGW